MQYMIKEISHLFWSRNFLEIGVGLEKVMATKSWCKQGYILSEQPNPISIMTKLIGSLSDLRVMVGQERNYCCFGFEGICGPETNNSGRRLIDNGNFHR